MSERWLPIPGYEGIYEVSDQGRVRSLARLDCRGNRVPGRLRKTHTERVTGYLQASLWRDGVGQTHRAHSLMMLAFVGPRPEGAEIRHLDGNPTNNRLGNLAYGTRHENRMDRIRHGTDHNTRKTHCPRNHPYDAENTRVYRGSRYCKACCTERDELRGKRLRAVS